MFDAIGHPVDHLKRIAIGPIRDHGLKLGRWRDLTESEVTALKKAAAYQSKTAPRKQHERTARRALPPPESKNDGMRAERQDGRERPQRREGQRHKPTGRPRRQR